MSGHDVQMISDQGQLTTIERSVNCPCLKSEWSVSQMISAFE